MPRGSDSQFRVEHATFSDLGMRRANNQDAVSVVLDSRKSGKSRGDVYLVADGMGAHAAGELASKLAVDCIPHAYQKLSDHAPPAALRQAVRKANSLIYSKGQSDPDLQGMGTTCSCLVLLSGAALVAHVGDSRVYRLRDGALEQLTFDHSLVWELAAASKTTADDVPDCIPKNVITRSLGPHEQVNVDLEGPHALADGDVFLICSDGLTAVVSDDLIGSVIGAIAPDEAGQTLVDLANLLGGPDNISVVVARVAATTPAEADDMTAAHAPSRFRGVQPGVWAILLACLAGVAWFTSTQEYEWAIAASAGVGAAAVIAMMQRNQQQTPGVAADLGGPYGDGPYRKIDCLPGKPAAEAIGAVVEQLAELEHRGPAEGGPPVDDWADFHKQRQAAFDATSTGDLSKAVSAYAGAIRGLMQQVRANRTEHFEGRIDL